MSRVWGSEPDSPMYLDSATTMPEPQRALPPDVEKAYLKYVGDHHGDLSDTAGFAETLFNAGARQMVLAMREVSGVLPELARLEHRINRIRQMLEELQ